MGGYVFEREEASMVLRWNTCDRKSDQTLFLPLPVIAQTSLRADDLYPHADQLKEGGEEYPSLILYNVPIFVSSYRIFSPPISPTLPPLPLVFFNPSSASLSLFTSLSLSACVRVCISLTSGWRFLPMSLVRWKPVALHCETPRTALPTFRCRSRSHLSRSICYNRRPVSRSIPCLRLPMGAPSRRPCPIVRAAVTRMPSLGEADNAEVLLSQTFNLEHSKTVEGKVTVRLDPAGVDANGNKWTLAVGCTMEGKWTLHWGVTYLDDIGSEWDQPPPEMRPPDSVLIKDYAIETPFKKISSSADVLQEVHIDFGCDTSIAAIHFVLKEEDTGSWFQHKGRDFIISFSDKFDGDNDATEKQGFGIWPGAFNHISNLLLKAEGPDSKNEDHAVEDKDTTKQNMRIAKFYKEFPVLKKEQISNYMTVFVKKCNDTCKKLIQFDTDLPGDVKVHWGVCKNDGSKWVIPSPPHPPETKIFRQKVLQTLLQRKESGTGSWGLFLVDEETAGVVFALKFNDYTWLNNMGSDFYVPMENVSSLTAHEQNQPTETETQNESAKSQLSEETDKAVVAYTDEIIQEIKTLVTDMSPEKGQGPTKEVQEGILQEIEKLAAEAYSIFTGSVPGFGEPSPVAPDKPAITTSSGTGSGHEILCQGFNWESHKSGKWYSDLRAKTEELASLGFTVIWLPPPTESVSPEGYMPKDLYNLNSRYGNMEELKNLVKSFHEVNIKVLGDVVLNHRCAHYQNEHGIWNIFGGRLNWDARAIVADDPHFQGKGNKSSGDNFHAAPNIDHSQEFVRNDIIEWLRWLGKEIGYDGWRLDFVRGFWGGYVKDYLEATDPYFSVGEYWDSLSYTYGVMDHNQDAHRQRIIDWINATNGASGAFDVTTKGILHSAIERCEYWRLCDENGKPPGVVGWWSSRAVTFIENHDTGSTQGHWRFPGGKEMQGYAYILTHPGTPAVFYDHIFSHHQKAISNLISVRKRNNIHCRSTVKITKSERDVYAAHIDEKLAVKIGPGHYYPNGSKQWEVVAEGADFKVWEKSS